MDYVEMIREIDEEGKEAKLRIEDTSKNFSQYIKEFDKLSRKSKNLPITKKIENFEDSYYRLDTVLERCTVYHVDRQTGEIVHKRRIRRGVVSSFMTKNCYTAEHVSDFDVIYKDYRDNNIQTTKTMLDTLAKLNERQCKMLILLAENLQGLNTGCVHKDKLREISGRNFTRELSVLEETGNIKRIKNLMKPEWITYKINPSLAYRCSKGFGQTLMLYWKEELLRS